MQTTITTEGIYTKGVVIPRIKPAGRRTAIVTFLPVSSGRRDKSDEELWKEIEPVARKTRQKLFKEIYPSIYAKNKRWRA